MYYKMQGKWTNSVFSVIAPPSERLTCDTMSHRLGPLIIIHSVLRNFTLKYSLTVSHCLSTDLCLFNSLSSWTSDR